MVLGKREGQVIAPIVKHSVGDKQRTGRIAGDVVAVGAVSAVDGHGRGHRLNKEPVIPRLSRQRGRGVDSGRMDEVEVIQVAAAINLDRIGGHIARDRQDRAHRVRVFRRIAHLAAANHDLVSGFAAALDQCPGRQSKIITGRGRNTAGERQNPPIGKRRSS